MKTFIHYLSVLIATLIIVSCENELPFSIKDNPPKLVMNALINAESQANLLFLNFTGKDATTHIQNATIEVRVTDRKPASPSTETGRRSAMPLQHYKQIFSR